MVIDQYLNGIKYSTVIIKEIATIFKDSFVIGIALKLLFQIVESSIEFCLLSQTISITSGSSYIFDLQI